MPEVTGEFETHLTVPYYYADRVAEFAQERGLSFVHIELDRGDQPSQPMLTFRGTGTLADQLAAAEELGAELSRFHCCLVRVKVEAAPWNPGVPRTDEEAEAEPAGRYFEHHVKLVLPGVQVNVLVPLTRLVAQHEARLSRNARRGLADGRHERFVTQRCHGVGRSEAQWRLDMLVAALRAVGHEPVEVVQEYVVHDSAESHDAGWLTPQQSTNGEDRMSRYEDRMRHARAGADGYPSTYQPTAKWPGMSQRAAFDPALKQFRHAYRAGEPWFTDPEPDRRWRSVREEVLHHLLRLVTDGPGLEHLVLRGSLPLRTWLGKAARDPGDLDFVVVPHTLTMESPQARELLDGVVAAVRRNPGPHLDPDWHAVEDIWTYERAPGRRLVFRFDAPGVPSGSVQLDFVFQEEMPLPPVRIEVPPSGTVVSTAAPELALAWKLLWLETDTYPQGKDLYDAALLAEYTTVSFDLVRGLLRPELGSDADDFTPESVLRWRVEWQNFRDEYPQVTGDETEWLHRLAVALDRSRATD